MTQGLVLRTADADIERRAKAEGVPVTVQAHGPLPYTKNVLVDGVRIPWDRLATGFALLERWDALCALGKPGELLSDVGTATERSYTKAVVRDLRLPVYEPGLLFVRNSEEGQALVDTYRDERGDVAQPQLAFARAAYRVKPRLCPLPQVWTRPQKLVPLRNGRGRRRGSRLVTVEISPGRCVKCAPGDEEQVREMYAERARRRRK